MKWPLVLVLAACAGRDGAGPAKPGAPIDVTLSATPLAGDDWEVRLVGRAQVALAGGELFVGAARRDFGPLAAGGTAELVVRVHAPPDELVGGARVAGGGRATHLTLRPVAAKEAARVIATPFGAVTETRP